MSINFIPNDPKSTGSKLRKITPRSGRPSARAGFNYFAKVKQGLYQPGSPDFTFWQCRESALWAIKTWEDVNGTLKKWQPGKRLDLMYDAGEDLNAYYDRSSLSFYHMTFGSKTMFSGDSTDVVSHEAGHAFLDVIKPALWDSLYFEVNAFHEAFGDCVSLAVAISDLETRKKLVSKLKKKNSVETLAEQLAWGIHKDDPTHNAGKPRQAKNKLKWVAPESLPADGKPGKLIREIHSFSQVFTGCFYDTIVNRFNQSTPKNEKTLLEVTRATMKLLIKATKQAPEKPRYFREVGRIMMLLDQKAGSKNVQAISDAFKAHNIPLGSSVMMAPESALAGGAPRRSSAPRKKKKAAAASRPTPTTRTMPARSAAAVSPATRRDLAARLSVSSPRALSFVRHVIAGEPVVVAEHARKVKLDAVSKRLKGVVGVANETVLVGATGSTSAVLGSLPDNRTTQSDVLTFVRSLVSKKAIAFDAPAAVRKGAAMYTNAEQPDPVTHVIRTVSGEKRLVRLRFACCGALSRM